MSSPQMREIIDQLRRRQAARATQPRPSLEEARATFAPAGKLNPLPEDVIVTSADADGIPSFWLDTPEAEPGQILFYLHGGGYTRGSLRSHGPLAAGAVLLSPLLDLTASGPSVEDNAGQDPVFTPEAVRSFGPAYLGAADPEDPAASPIFGSQAGLPPLLIQAGSAELLLSDSERLAHAATDAGVDVTLHVADGLPHVYHGALHTPETASAIQQIADFADRL
jgi:acetyl esterase/lipase